jgi:hypothetical protein
LNRQGAKDAKFYRKSAKSGGQYNTLYTLFQDWNIEVDQQA